MISIITEIGLLTNLKLLEVAYNEIKIIPSEIGLLSNLWGLKVGEYYAGAHSFYLQHNVRAFLKLGR